MNSSTKKIKSIFKKIQRANLKYRLVNSGDRIAVGLSGGKDSFTLLYFLQLLRRRTPLDFEIYPVYIDLGWENDVSFLRQFCSMQGLSLLIKKTNIKQVVFDIRKEKSPCSLCSHLRRGALNRLAKEHSCNKVALGHHLDDAVNTLFMSILYENRFNVFKPCTYLDRIGLTVIRPLIYVEESDINSFISSEGITPVENKCPVDGYTKRDEVKALVNEIEKRCPGAKNKFLACLENVAPDCFWQKI